MSNTNLKRTITEIEIAAAGVKSLTRCLNFLHDACLDRGSDNDLAAGDQAATA